MTTRNGLLLLILISLSPFKTLKAQEVKNLYVEYEININNLQKEAALISNGKKSVFNIPEIKISEKDSKKLIKNEAGNYVVYAKNGQEVIYNDFSAKNFVIVTSLNNTKYKILDTPQPLQWQLVKNKTKQINGTKVFQATTSFRGRNYIAWYNPAIPIPAGPWKFSGLPGLIMEITDAENRFRWAAKTIKYPYELKEGISIPTSEELENISYKNFIEQRNNFRDNQLKVGEARLPKGTTLVSSKTSRGIELKYEWEKE